jgi:hypothetical protein
MSKGTVPCNLAQRRAGDRRWVIVWLALTATFAATPILAYSQSIGVPKPGPTEAAMTSGLLKGASLSGSTTPSINSLILESEKVGAAMHARLPEYTYVQTRIVRELDSKRKIVEHTSAYEAYPVNVLGHRRHIISLIREDGAPLSPKRLRKERQQAASAIEAAERDNATGRAGASPKTDDKYISAGIGLNRSGEGVWIGVSQFLRHCRFGELRREALAGREMIALTIESCSIDEQNHRERYLSRMTGTLWIDASENVVARLEAWPTAQAEQSEKGATAGLAGETIVYEQVRLQNGLWVPRRIRLNAIGRAALFNGTDNDMTFEFTEYLHFGAEVKDLEQAILKPKS